MEISCDANRPIKRPDLNAVLYNKNSSINLTVYLLLTNGLVCGIYSRFAHNRVKNKLAIGLKIN